MLEDYARLQQVFSRELTRLITALTVARESIKATTDVLEGCAQDTTASELVRDALWKHEVPASFDLPDGLDSSRGHSLAAWQKLMSDRVQCLRGWFLEGPPVSYWLGGFSCPHSFVTALLQ